MVLLTCEYVDSIREPHLFFKDKKKEFKKLYGCSFKEYLKGECHFGNDHLFGQYYHVKKDKYIMIYDDTNGYFNIFRMTGKC